MPVHLHRPMDLQSLPERKYTACNSHFISKVIIFRGQSFFFHVKFQNVYTCPGPVFPSEQYAFSFAQFSLSISVTLTSRSLGDILPVLSCFPQPQTIHDVGSLPISWSANSMGLTFWLNFALELSFKNKEK